MVKQRGLSKGLSSMLNNGGNDVLTGEMVRELKIIDVEPNKDQPRKEFDEEKLNDLAESISQMGVILPIIVVKNDSGRYTIIAGERRFRASKLAGKKTIPAIVKNYNDKTAAEVSLIENLQRENLNPIEEAKGYKSLIDGFSMTQEEISKRVGKNRTTITNALRILNLPDNILKLIISGDITQGHARALLSVSDNSLKEEIARKIIKEDLSVRQTEALVKNLSSKDKKTKTKNKSQVDIEISSISEKLSESLGTKVSIKHGQKKGKIEIEYYGNDDLDRILKIIG